MTKEVPLVVVKNTQSPRTTVLYIPCTTKNGAPAIPASPTSLPTAPPTSQYNLAAPCSAQPVMAFGRSHVHFSSSDKYIGLALYVKPPLHADAPSWSGWVPVGSTVAYDAGHPDLAPVITANPKEKSGKKRKELFYVLGAVAIALVLAFFLYFFLMRRKKSSSTKK